MNYQQKEQSGGANWPMAGDPAFAADDVVFTSPARAQIENLDYSEQAKLSRGLSTVYGRVLEFQVRLALQTFVHRTDTLILETLRKGMVTFNIYDYAVRVKICKNTNQWTIQSIGLPGSLDGFEIHKMPSG